MKKKWDKRFVTGCIVSAAVFGVIMALFMNGVFSFLGKAKSESSDTLIKAIRQASVQCYAIEGRYPPSVEYLEENYGIQIDRERYNVFYSGFASNIMPDITVIPAKGGEDSEWQP